MDAKCVIIIWEKKKNHFYIVKLFQRIFIDLEIQNWINIKSQTPHFSSKFFPQKSNFEPWIVPTFQNSSRSLDYRLAKQ